MKHYPPSGSSISRVSPWDLENVTPSNKDVLDGERPRAGRWETGGDGGTPTRRETGGNVFVGQASVTWG